MGFEEQDECLLQREPPLEDEQMGVASVWLDNKVPVFMHKPTGPGSYREGIDEDPQEQQGNEEEKEEE